VLPVVARKKGLDGHYEDVNGSPQPKKVGNSIEPVRKFPFIFEISEFEP
jgi:serine/arginine repetitive matrix protein 1